MSPEDFEEIRNTLALYAHLIDNGEWDRLGEVYAPDGSYGPHDGEPNEGLEAIAHHITSGVQVEIHTSTNHYIEPGADDHSATGRGKFIAVFKDGRVAAGDYRDVYVKLEDGWRIRSRRSNTRVR